MTTIYRKYRPSTFSEVSGQKYTLQTLTNAIKNSQVSHAYLLTGPRGTGKTTIARVFAKTVNCLEPITKTTNKHVNIEPCNKCTNCQMILDNKAIDLIEIDAASHTGVDNIRQLKEAINIPPTNFKYKVYIIDEVHMLSMGAFNALLKTLEEPPPHAIFILATTELHKVPATILSRCQQFNIKPLTKDQIVERLKQITKKEKIKIDTKSLELIAIEASGGMRDAESLLEQIISLGSKKITTKNIQQILGISSRDALLNIITAIIENNASTAITTINKLQEDGINIRSFNKQLLNYFRNLMLVKITLDSNNNLLKNLTSDEILELKNTHKKISLPNITILIALFQNSLKKSNQSDIPQLPLEMALIEYFLKTNKTLNTNIVQPTLKKKSSDKSITTPQSNITPKKSSPDTQQTTKNQESNNSITGTKTITNTIDLSINDFLDNWAEILEEVKKGNPSTAGFLKNCAPTAIEKNIALIKTNYPFHKDKLNDQPNKLTIEKIFAKILKVPLKVKFLTEDEISEQTTNSKQILLKKSSATIISDKKSTDTNTSNILYEAMKKIGGKIIKD